MTTAKKVSTPNTKISVKTSSPSKRQETATRSEQVLAGKKIYPRKSPQENKSFKNGSRRGVEDGRKHNKPPSRSLTVKEKEILLEMIAAGYSRPAINARFEEEGFDPISRWCYLQQSKRNQPQIEVLKKTRFLEAMSTGLAIRAERVQRLKEHAERLFMSIWWLDEDGHPWVVAPVERAWRETLRQIAEEMGQLRYVEPTNPREAVFQRMRDLGLTLDDIAKDAVARELFTNLGIEFPAEAESPQLTISAPR